MSSLSGLTRTDIEEFLINEATLLDEWRLPEWRALFAPGCRYLVPNMAGDPHASPESELFLIADDEHHLTERVKRLGKKTAHAEYPRSMTQRMISNVCLLCVDADRLKVRSSFITFRTSQGVTDTYFGRHEYLLVQPNGSLLIEEKRTILGMGALRPHGKLSIIV
jgi:p-cumate 2,3-dioxygenase beta subunit